MPFSETTEEYPKTTNQNRFHPIQMCIARDCRHSKLPIAEKVKPWVIHHAKTPVYRSLLLPNYPSKHYIPLLSPLAFSPDPIRLLPLVKNLFKEQRLSSSEEVQRRKQACNPHLRLCK
ncbi:hypothetical protein AVEN_30601-1 [Araneus ventricosus]|uniref:Uncharacterized protein n=1 Tax=Araneus ventricosus TaxID=182803 RepID=A0A4Y2ES93_ARAVE|nr:hypothetical protein AVEN_30601-1 [Araneus ventricosus]